MNFIRKRILIAIIVFIVALNLDFFLPRLVPGNIAQTYASGHLMPTQDVQLIEARFGLNQPLYIQYFDFIKNVFSWPPYFGVSFQFYPQPVTSLVLSRTEWTLILIAASGLIAAVWAFAFAAVSAMRRGGKFEMSSLYSSIIFWSIPGFWFAMLLIWVFGVSLRWFPIFGTVGYNVVPGSMSYALSVIWHAVLPVTTLSLIMYGHYYIILRGSSQEALASDYVIAARGRGLRERVVSLKYVMRNSILPVVSLLGFSIAQLVSIEVVVEAVYSYAGVGDLIVDAVLYRDYPLIEGTFFYLTMVVILFGLFGDFLLIKLDPRLTR